jgi:lysyl-tRNA synthetase class 2
MLEFYASFLTYENIMDLTEELIEKLALDLKGGTELDFNGYKIDVKRPWKRVSVRDASLQTYGIDPIELNAEELKKFLGIKEDLSRDKLLTIFIEEKLENLFIQPTFLINYPMGVGAPDKTNIKDKLTTERTEVFIAKGFELANLGSINNDPEFLKKHNIQNLINKYGEQSGSEKYLDVDFLYEMGFGIPPLACCGIGVDRLTMLLSNKSNINETIIYPFKNQNEY